MKRERSQNKIKKTWFVLPQEVSEFPVLVEIVSKRLRKSTCLIEAVCEDEGSDILILRGGSYLNNESVISILFISILFISIYII